MLQPWSPLPRGAWLRAALPTLPGDPESKDHGTRAEGFFGLELGIFSNLGFSALGMTPSVSPPRN